MTLFLAQIDQALDPGGTIQVPPEVMEEGTESIAVSAMGLLNSYAHIFAIAFVITLLVTPLIRRVAIAFDVIDHPDDPRKAHAYPVAYLGGLAVLVGLIVATGTSYVFVDPVANVYPSVPLPVVMGMIAITFTGLIDDVSGLFPHVKIAGQLVAAAALAIYEVGTHVAEGLLKGFMGPPEQVIFTVADLPLLNQHVYYWVGTALIAVFVLGGCNAMNFVDGLDGLASGLTGIIAVGLLAISLLMAIDISAAGEIPSDSLAGARLVLCLALLGAVLGFLPHNFNPASIFLGDAGSLLLGYMCATIILMLGDQGRTDLVFAGLIVFSVPIIDATLAIIRRRLAGIPLSSADDQHLHHQLKRALGGVKRAVLALYGISALFAVVGVTLAALVTQTEMRVRVVYAIALALFSFVGVIAVKAARQQQIRLAVANAGRGQARKVRKKSPARAPAAGRPSKPPPKSSSGQSARPSAE
ncbi:MAG: undecaprenyl/decaprenyl-phosphate alpha-N-acetylglucosaminyl 1-phosphate transferase [Phycisphaerales bacterium]|nr:MAG: undecaprenyl/decaprenyl-phosphate alpha-N-acetylglucosaminyl 1-phosphate transferase [Phycisphaerales bacterium]